MRRVMRALSYLALWGAIFSLAALAVYDLLRLCGVQMPALPWAAKSAIPLIAIGFSYICLVLTDSRGFLQKLLGTSVGLAFILWGTEQYLPDRTLAGYLDDLVVFLFVLDLSLVVKKSLGESGKD
jgi:hypothetical protein